MDERPGLSLFVYGTLMRRGRYHAVYFPVDTPAVAARIRGRLFQLQAGYPAVELAETHRLATATGAFEADERTEREWRPVVASFVEPGGTEGWVHGELVTVGDPLLMRMLDRLEGFRPGRRSLFLRVLAPVWVRSEHSPRPAWVYVQQAPRGRFVPTGR